MWRFQRTPTAIITSIKLANNLGISKIMAVTIRILSLGTVINNLTLLN